MKIYSKQKNRAFTRTPKLGVTPKGGGFTLIETLVAISIFTMSILGLMTVLASGISNTNYAKQKMTATYLAQEGIEYTRNKRDTSVLYDVNGWDTFKEILPTSPDSQFYPVSANFPGFTRLISAEIGEDEIKIISTVECTQCPSRYSITFSENLFNWVE